MLENKEKTTDFENYTINLCVCHATVWIAWRKKTRKYFSYEIDSEPNFFIDSIVYLKTYVCVIFFCMPKRSVSWKLRSYHDMS